MRREGERREEEGEEEGRGGREGEGGLERCRLYHLPSLYRTTLRFQTDPNAFIHTYTYTNTLKTTRKSPSTLHTTRKKRLRGRNFTGARFHQEPESVRITESTAPSGLNRSPWVSKSGTPATNLEPDSESE